MDSRVTIMSVKSWITRRIYLLILTTSSFYSPRGVEGEQHHHQVTGSTQPILARAGEDVTLPCRIEPSRRATRLTVEWSRADLEPAYVHVRQQGHQVSRSLLNAMYRTNRTALFVPELHRGNLSLRLSGARLSDEGSFKCFVPNLRSSALVRLRVGEQHHHQVTGSTQPILARAGEDVTLPCRIEPSRRATRLTVEWSRADLEPAYVHVRQQGHQVSRSLLNAMYRTNRTALFVPELHRGNLSLRLSGARLSDEGSFKCFVPNLRSSALVRLRVGLVSQPVISTGPKRDDGGVALTCDSGCWYPRPEVSWLDSGGNLLLAAEPSVTVFGSPGDPPTVTVGGGPGGCYAVRRNVTVRAAGRVTCRVHLPHINHTVETHRSVVPDHNSTQPTSVDVMAVIRSIVVRNIIIGSVLASVGCIAGCLALFAYCLLRKKAGTSNGSEEDNGHVTGNGSDVGIEEKREEQQSILVCTDDTA